MQNQVAYYFGQVTGLAHKEGATREEIMDLVDELTDKVIEKADADERIAPG